MKKFQIIFPKQEVDEIWDYPWDFQKKIQQHKWWYQGARLAYDFDRECYTLYIGELNVDKVLPEWEAYCESIGAVVVKTVARTGRYAPFKNSKEYKHWLRTGEKPSDLH